MGLFRYRLWLDGRFGWVGLEYFTYFAVFCLSDTCATFCLLKSEIPSDIYIDTTIATAGSSSSS
jgi:hypothetical protein